MLNEVKADSNKTATKLDELEIQIDYHNERINENEAKVAKVDAKLAMEAKVKLLVVKI